MKPLSRTLGVLSLVLVVGALAIPALAAVAFLVAHSSALLSNAAVGGIAVAVAGLVVAVVGYLVGRRVESTALPIVGGLTSLLVAIGFGIALLLT